MLTYTLRRPRPALFVLATLSFFIIRLSPGGPSIRQACRFDRQLDAARLTNRWLVSTISADGGAISTIAALQGLHRHRADRARPPLSQLSAWRPAVALTGVPLGAFAAGRADSGRSRHPEFSMLGVVLPGFVVGPLLALVFGIYWPIFRVGGYEPGVLSFLVLPVITLALPVSAYIARLMRNSVEEVLRANYIRTARAKGLAARDVFLRHALRPALIPMVSYLGPAVAFVVTGSLVVESVFGLPGSGRFLIQGAVDRDYPMVMGMILVYGVLTLLCNLIADLLYARLDPRVRLA
jgi:oligopeptide transport system permease protein